jgi:hypothetical protein
MSGKLFIQRNNKYFLKIFISVFFICLTILFHSKIVFSYSNTITHPGITKKAIERDDSFVNFLKLLGFDNKLRTNFTINPDYIYDDELITDMDNFRENFNKWIFTDPCGEFGTKEMVQKAGITPVEEQTLLDWFKLGSVLADAPIVRASDHFHDPTNNRGLDNTGQAIALWGTTDALAYLIGKEKLEECYADMSCLS